MDTPVSMYIPVASTERWYTRNMRYDKDNNALYVRQSWLGSYLICPNRSRYDITMTALRRPSDVTAMGTAVHSAIEAYLNNEVTELGDMVVIASTDFTKALENPDMRLTETSRDMDHAISCIRGMVTGWYDSIRPHVVLGGLVEHKFQAPLGVTVNADGPCQVFLEGMIDYVAPDNTIWDWKTSGRSYSAKEKQKQSHQATCYVTACRTLGLVSNGNQPTAFRFGVMIRQPEPKAQIITVARDNSHVEWLRRQIGSVAVHATMMPKDCDWPMNDQHNLCSPKWCDYWSLCKGAHWADTDMDPPSQIVPLATS